MVFRTEPRCTPYTPIKRNHPGAKQRKGHRFKNLPAELHSFIHSSQLTCAGRAREWAGENTVSELKCIDTIFFSCAQCHRGEGFTILFGDPSDR